MSFLTIRDGPPTVLSLKSQPPAFSAPLQLLPSKDRILRTKLSEVQALAQRVLHTSDPAKTRELLAQLNV